MCPIKATLIKADADDFIRQSCFYSTTIKHKSKPFPFPTKCKAASNEIQDLNGCHGQLSAFLAGKNSKVCQTLLKTSGKTSSLSFTNCTLEKRFPERSHRIGVLSFSRSPYRQRIFMSAVVLSGFDL